MEAPEAQCLLTEEEVSKRICVSLGALRRWRQEGRGPRFLKVSALVRYRPEDIETWINTRPAGGEQLTPGVPLGAAG
jgi:predicted DNA-binding transcriptional regulator AlpA